MDKTYTRDQIKEAIRIELISSDFMGENNSRFYEIIGIVVAGLDEFDKKQKEVTNG